MTVYFWSNETAVAEEVFQEFERLMFRNLTFSNYCDEMTARYNECSHIKISFMSKNTFINSFFGWLGSMKLDFREHVDPWCGYNPQHLACDGTHVGVSMKMIKVDPIEKAGVNEMKPNPHRWLDRVFLAEPSDVRAVKNVRNARFT